MSKSASRLRSAVKKGAQKVVHSNYLKTNIPACMASPGPPLGPMLGQRGINIAQFCKDFNERTKEYKNGIPLPCRITVRPDRSYELIITSPPSSYFLMQAAGASKGAINAGDKAGMVSLKHIYEIALIKSKDPALECVPLPHICNMLIGTARSIGIEVVRELDVEYYGRFLEERRKFLEEHQRQLDEKRKTKLLKTV